MTAKRIAKLKIRPIEIPEIIEILAQFDPVYKEEEEAFVQWYAKTPLGRSRQRALELESEQAEMDNENKRLNEKIKLQTKNKRR